MHVPDDRTRPLFGERPPQSGRGAGREAAACAAALSPPVEGDARADVVIESDAGFVEVPAHELFNGGPGFATTLGFLPYGTGPRTLRIPEGGMPADAVWEDNPHSFTRFANLLYIDEPLAGLSYGLGTRFETACAVDPGRLSGGAR
jgi:hypothetical protein